MDESPEACAERVRRFLIARSGQTGTDPETIAQRWGHRTAETEAAWTPRTLVAPAGEGAAEAARAHAVQSTVTCDHGRLLWQSCRECGLLAWDPDDEEF